MKNLKNNTIIKEAFKNYYNVNDDIIQALSRQYDGLPFHTFQAWKEKGYSIKKGSKGKPVYIWKYATKKQRENEETEKDESGRFIKALAYFFDISQVEKHGSTTPGNKVKMLPALIYSDIRKALYKPMEAPGSSVYIKDGTLYINKYNYRFKLNIENIIKLKSADFNKIISEIKDHDEIITQLLEIYEKKKDIYKYPTELKTVYNTKSIQGSAPGKRTERQLKEAIKKNITALNELQGTPGIKENATIKILKTFTAKNDIRPVLMKVASQDGCAVACNSYIAARSLEKMEAPIIENYPNLRNIFQEAKKASQEIKLTIKQVQEAQTQYIIENGKDTKKEAIIKLEYKDINGNIKPLVLNCNYTITVLKATKEAPLYIYENIKPLYTRGNGIEAVLTPCKPY